MCISEVLFFSLEQNLSASPSSHLVEFLHPEPTYYNLGPPQLPSHHQHETEHLAQVNRRRHFQEKQKPAPFQTLSSRAVWTGWFREEGVTWPQVAPESLVPAKCCGGFAQDMGVRCP